MSAPPHAPRWLRLSARTEPPPGQPPRQSRASLTVDSLERLDAFRSRNPGIQITLEHADGQAWYRAAEQGHWSRTYDDVTVMLDDLEKRYPA